MSPRSGRSRIAQRFIAGIRITKRSQSVKRTPESVREIVVCSPLKRALIFGDCFPSAEALGYYQTSANADEDQPSKVRMQYILSKI